MARRRTITLVFAWTDPERTHLAGETPRDTALMAEVWGELEGTVTPKTLAGLVQAAGLARVRLVIRTDLGPKVDP